MIWPRSYPVKRDHSGASDDLQWDVYGLLFGTKHLCSKPEVSLPPDAHVYGFLLGE